MLKYESMNDWLDEIVGFTVRVEWLDLDLKLTAEQTLALMKWLEAAFEAGREEVDA